MAKAQEGEAISATQAGAVEDGENEGGVGLIDFSSVGDEKEFPVLPRGIYPVTIDEVTFGHSQSSGNPMWTWKFEVSEGEYAGQKLFFHTPFVESMLPRVKKVLSRVAPELLNGPFNPEKIADSGILIGKACRVRVDIRPYEGKKRNNVKDVLEAAAGGGDFLS